MYICLVFFVDDFYLFLFFDLFVELGDYIWSYGFIYFFFCKICGVCCFFFVGEGEVEEVEGLDGEKRKVWYLKRGLKEGCG